MSENKKFQENDAVAESSENISLNGDTDQKETPKEGPRDDAVAGPSGVALQLADEGRNKNVPRQRGKSAGRVRRERRKRNYYRRRFERCLASVFMAFVAANRQQWQYSQHTQYAYNNGSNKRSKH